MSGPRLGQNPRSAGPSCGDIIPFMLKDFLQGKWLGHPLHPALVHVPLGSFTAALLFDVLSRVGVGGNAMVQTSFYCIAVGVIVALLAAPAGLADWLDIKS